MEKVEVISECKTPSVISSFLELWDKKNNQCIIIVQKRLHELKNCLHFVSYTFITHRDNIGRGGYARNWHSSININYHQINTSMSQSSRWTFGFMCTPHLHTNQNPIQSNKKDKRKTKHKETLFKFNNAKNTLATYHFYDLINFDQSRITRTFLYYLQDWVFSIKTQITSTSCCTWGRLSKH